MISINIQKQLKSANNELFLNIKLGLPSHGIFAISGPSGVGKTTLFNLISGLSKPDSGIIRYNNLEWFNHKSRINLAPQKRDLAYVFQTPVLFPNMSVLQNLKFAFNVSLTQDYWNELILRSDLSSLLNQKPKQLSGGQKQRVAIVMALLQNPKVLLLDESFSGLDKDSIIKMQSVIEYATNQHKICTLLISHNIHFSSNWASKSFLLNNGVIEEVKPKLEEGWLKAKVNSTANGVLSVELESGVQTFKEGQLIELRIKK